VIKETIAVACEQLIQVIKMNVAAHHRNVSI
jgi:hypothetical protein